MSSDATPTPSPDMPGGRPDATGPTEGRSGSSLPVPESERSRWYADGLRFKCTMCGNCCTGPPGWVSFTDEEAAAMAAELGVSLREFMREFTHTTRGRRSLRENLTDHGYDCVFLDRESVPGKALCRVYRSRPEQCRTWPFWPENLRHPRQWEAAAQICPGIDRGELVPLRVIVERRDRTPD